MTKRSTIILALCLAVGLGSFAAGQGRDDRNRESQLRSVRGTVIDKEENGIANGIVYLKNLKTQNVKTHVTGDDGRYRISGLDPNVDYEIHAEHNDLTSSKRRISSLDSNRDIVIHLKVDKKK